MLVHVLLVMALILGSTCASLAQEEMLVLDNADAYPAKQRVAVSFPHDMHMSEFECLECHHDYAEGENILDEEELEEDNPAITCFACHDADASIDLKKAHHRQCIGCHKQMRKEQSGMGPELCGECHVRRRPE